MPPRVRSRIIPHLGVTDAVWKIVVCVTVLCNMNTDAALDWIHRRQRWKGTRSGIAPNWDRDVLRYALETFIISASADFLHRCIDSDIAELGLRNLRHATKVSRAYDVKKWVSQRNVEHGAVVPSADMHSKWLEFIQDSSQSGVQLPLEGIEMNNSTMRTWANRFRSQNHIRHGHLRIKEPLHPADKQEKAKLHLRGIFK